MISKERLEEIAMMPLPLRNCMEIVNRESSAARQAMDIAEIEMLIEQRDKMAEVLTKIIDSQALFDRYADEQSLENEAKAAIRNTPMEETP